MTRFRVVVPVFNEARVVEELARRCLAAAREVDPFALVVLVDDASTDDTAARVPKLHGGVEVRALPVNRGQFGATQAGLAEAVDGEIVGVLDGDLQDPPEHLGALYRLLVASPQVDVVFATKTAREDSYAFRVGRAGYAAGLRLAGVRRPPSGAGTYCVMRAPWARRVAGVRLRHVNLAPLLTALGARAHTIPYEKLSRYDGTSRVGWTGLAREALGSWWVAGVAERALGGLGVVQLLAGTLWPPCAGMGIATLLLTFGVARYRMSSLTPPESP